MTLSVDIVCFFCSYALALLLELTGSWQRFRWRRLAPWLVAIGGITAHTWYLGQRVSEVPAAPLSSPHDWYLTAAWMLAAVYLAVTLYYPKPALGLLLLLVVLGLIGASYWATTASLATFESPRFYGMAHGVLLMLGTVAVLCGFLAGVMYLAQSYRLKRKLPTDDRFALPSLEWLERVNSGALGAALVCVGLGFFAGVVSRLGQAGGSVPWSDPVVLSLSGMLIWLLAAELFRFVYPEARQGRKVAYLTLAAFVFLMLTLAAFATQDSLHRPAKTPAASSTTAPGGGR